jgi:DNA-nicking Smr family endonuclease
MADVRPLAGRPPRLVTPPPPRSVGRPPRHSGGSGRADTEETSSAVTPLTALARAGDGFAFAAAGVDHKLLRQLESGQRRPEATLDLHGRKSAEARPLLEAFVRGAQSSGRRVVLIVHGRGLGSGDAGPVLRNLVHEQLTSGPLSRAVLAIVAAPPRLGGSGAALVWLRKVS